MGLYPDLINKFLNTLRVPIRVEYVVPELSAILLMCRFMLSIKYGQSRRPIDNSLTDFKVQSS